MCKKKKKNYGNWATKEQAVARHTIHLLLIWIFRLWINSMEKKRKCAHWSVFKPLFIVRNYQPFTHTQTLRQSVHSLIHLSSVLLTYLAEKENHFKITIRNGLSIFFIDFSKDNNNTKKDNRTEANSIKWVKKNYQQQNKMNDDFTRSVKAYEKKNEIISSV